jgi:uncharacterized protein
VRLVLDTNTALSGLLWSGPPSELIAAAQSRSIELASSTPLLAELQSVLARDKFSGQLAKRGIAASEVFNGYATLVTVVVPAAIPPTVLNDPDDDEVLACAVAANAAFIVSGDRHLLAIGRFRNISIIKATDAATLVSAATRV